MSIPLNLITNQTDYEKLRYEWIKLFEESGHENPDVYNDGVGLPTMGVGFNLTQEFALRTVLEFGFGVLKGNDLDDAYDAMKVAVTAANNQTTADMQLTLDTAWKAHNHDSTLFFVIEDTPARQSAKDKILTIFNEIIHENYEDPLTQRLSNNGITSFPNSFERLALVSLRYAGSSLIGTNLMDGIKSNNRFASWYEIRYQSNKAPDPGKPDNREGIAKRRYAESALFGLFSSNVASTQEAQQAVDGFIAKLDIIQKYEEDYGHKISDANLNLNSSSLLSSIDVATVGEIFKPATGYLLDRFNPQDGSIDLTKFANNIDGEVMLGIVNAQGEITSSVKGDVAKDKNDLLIAVEDKASTLVGGFGNDILIGNIKDDTLDGGDGEDHLIGNGGVDTLKGGAGDDYLDGGTGGDKMAGGIGSDTYYVDSLLDIITEKAGEGDADTIITSIDYALTAGQHEHIEKISLDNRGDGSGLLLAGNELDNWLIGNQLDNILLGGLGADSLYGGAGDDHLESGEEDVYGEGAINILDGGADNDTLVGGDGIDLLFGGTGDDTLFVGSGGIHVISPIEGYHLGWEYMNGGEGFDTYYVGTASNHAIIEDSDGQGEIYAKASDIGDNTYKLKGGSFWGPKTMASGVEADGYTETHANGNTSNYTVAYELDGSQTLIAFGFNIYNFYNGMLGIKLEGGRVDTGDNIVEDVLDKIVFDEAFSEEDKEKIRTAIKDVYEESPIARKMLRDFAVVEDEDIVINFSEGKFSTFIDGLEHLRDNDVISESLVSTAVEATEPGLYIDLNWLENNSYISTNGKAVADTLETALIHEFVHLMTGTHDTNNIGEKGGTVAFANTIYREMGLAEQVSYHAYDDKGLTHVTNFEYTHGQAIDRAFTLWSDVPTANDFDSTIGGNLRDLIIGNERPNSLRGGEGIESPSNEILNSTTTNADIEGQEGLDVINANGILEGLIQIADKGIIDPGWLPQIPAEDIESPNDTELDSAFNQLVQAHSSFGDVGDDTGLGKKDDGYRYILLVPEPLI